MKKIGLIFIATMALGSAAHAQWECPSRLGAALKPIGSSDFMWGAEATASGGWIKDNYAANGMLFVGLNYGKGKHSVYVEGGLKYWVRGTNKDLNFSDDGGTTVTHRNDHTDRFLPGLREAFYRFSGEKNTVTLGLQSTKGDDEYLMNERMLGANYQLRMGQWKLNAMAGSVLEEFARNGRFCTMGYLYNDIVTGRPRSYVGNDFGDTNFGMLSLSFLPDKPVDEFGDEGSRSLVSLDKLGAVAYTEFGRKITHTVAMGGVYGQWSFAGIEVKPEVLYQSAKNNNAVVYDVSAEKLVQWKSPQTTRFFARYVGSAAVSKGARAVNSFSNLFMGEALRMDVLEGPVGVVGVKHSLTKAKLSVKLQGALQMRRSDIGGDYGFVASSDGSVPTKMKELDLAVSKNFGKLLLVNATVGMLDYSTLEAPDFALQYKHVKTMFGKLELRFTF